MSPKLLLTDASMIPSIRGNGPWAQARDCRPMTEEQMQIPTRTG